MIPPILDDALGFNIYRAGLLFRRELIRALAEYKMTPEQWQVMVALWSTGESLNQSEIVQLTLKDKPTVSRIIARLERDGWIEKRPSDNDGRVTIIQPTEQSLKLKEEVPQKLHAHFNHLLEGVSKEEQESLMQSLKKIRKLFGD